ncbi:Uncharacterized protein APZ42_031452 [Daphnia magna]|uniref:Uncharacterized protein n=1 Tax=Daphnia magna TaxID=35525 RepID=A0A164MUN3_9CRUS|nr:Uncharacterized protein APZ42_031452 [Daphnia magna]
MDIQQPSGNKAEISVQRVNSLSLKALGDSQIALNITDSYQHQHGYDRSFYEQHYQQQTFTFFSRRDDHPSSNASFLSDSGRETAITGFQLKDLPKKSVENCDYHNRIVGRTFRLPFDSVVKLMAADTALKEQQTSVNLRALATYNPACEGSTVGDNDSVWSTLECILPKPERCPAFNPKTYWINPIESENQGS